MANPYSSQPMHYSSSAAAQQENRHYPNQPSTFDDQYEHPRQGTGGPGNASQYYQHSQDAPLGGDAPAFGSGTDGFGGTDTYSYEATNGTGRQGNSYAPQNDYRHEYIQRGNQNQRTNKSSTQQLRPYQTPAYNQSMQSHMMDPIDGQYSQTPYNQSTLHQYPPQSSPYDQRIYMGQTGGSDSSGIYPDRPPDMDKLNEAQKKISKEFPADLDESNGSMMKTAVANVKDWRTWLKWKYTHYYIIALVIILLVASLTIYHHQIVNWLTPTSKKVRAVSWGWIIPVIILFIVSFPPLFGHEIVGILLGVVYGLWIGFAILSLGTLLGEWGNFYAFKHFLRKHAERYERKSLNYACMAYIVREGGFLVILLARLSAIPGHFTTAVFATVGMNFFIFTIATLLSMPKQLVVVYLGVAIESSGSGTQSTSSKIIKYAVVILSTAVTIGVAFYLYGQMHKARPMVQAQLQKKRYDMLFEAASTVATSHSDESVFAADESTMVLNKPDIYSTDNLPRLNSKEQKSKSKWRWGRKGKEDSQRPVNDSTISLNPTNENQGKTVVIGNGVHMSVENSSVPRFSFGAEERLRGQKVQYVKASANSRRAQMDQNRGRQDQVGYPPASSYSAPPERGEPFTYPYQEREGPPPSTAPPFGPPGYDSFSHQSSYSGYNDNQQAPYDFRR